jgi:hypothetical protein
MCGDENAANIIRGAVNIKIKKWWERGIEQSRKMIISYDNLITRLWLSGAIMPYERGGYAAGAAGGGDFGGPEDCGDYDDRAAGATDTMIDERGLPPVPHQYWVDRLGFQQEDPVTDFRSGGVSSGGSARGRPVDVRFVALSWARIRVAVRAEKYS